MKAAYDVIVIGSGFGGAITACRLAQAGRSVCVLEKGRRWDRLEFPRAPGEVAAQALWNQKSRAPGRGFIEYLTFRRMDVIQGAGVGGGSLHYFNVHMQPPAAIFDQPGWPRQLNLKRLLPYYRLAADMLGATPVQPLGRRFLPRRTAVFEEAVAKAGWQAERVPICVHFGADGQPSPGGQPQSACQYCGNCLLGCHVHAKNTLDLNYIPFAEQLGAEVYPLHQAIKITPVANGYEVAYRDLGDEPACPVRQVGAKQVVVAAGTLGTNELLLRCKHYYRTLPKLSDRLGTHFSGNGDFLFAGTYYRDKLIDPGRGPSITACTLFRTRRNQFISIQDLGFPDPFIWYFNGVIPTASRARNMWRQMRRYMAETLGLELRFEANQLIEDGFLTHFLPYLGMCTDGSNGTLTLDREGRVQVNWPYFRNRAVFREMIRRMKILSEASGGRFVNSFLWETPVAGVRFGKTLTAHPLGGCGMSDDPREGVVNEYGEVWGYPGLFVADGSLMPSAIAVNPSATISALAERVAFHIIHGRDLREDNARTPRNRPAGVSRTAGNVRLEAVELAESEI